MKKILSPSILSIDFFNIKDIIDMLNNFSINNLHLDIMDGTFVPNISFGYQIVNNIRKYFYGNIEIHLMTINPEKHIDIFKDIKIQSIIVHYETCIHLHKTINIIKKYGFKAGVAINPHTPVFLLQDIISDLDIVTIMSVNPGFGGQNFIEKSYIKIQEVKELISKNKSRSIIEVDGGVNMKNINKLILNEVDIIVIGNAIFSNESNMIIHNKLKKFLSFID